MKKYKIKINNDVEAKECSALMKELGYKEDNTFSRFNSRDTFGIACSDGSFGYGPEGMTDEDDQELTLHQLLDLVVLKRNDVKDSNCTYRLAAEEKNYAGYLDSNDWMHIFKDGGWQAYVPVVSEELKAFYLNSKAKDPALISGADVPRLIKEGNQIQLRAAIGFKLGEWKDLDLERDEEELTLGDLINTRFEWRLKPQTIKLELEIPAPCKAKIGGRDDTSFVLNVGRHQYCYKTEEDYTKARDALEAVFDAAVRGTNS
ncbi:TPA: hypothetical protein LUC71_002554 [Acinetobacter baumannii]|uniref:hypothetical protein n=2 Tax=Acinetobacter baumannii TaxID=470 RepID=UPI0013C7602F|nr:hypothetical protein [Acinetobacter baumannii]NDW25396.1 hypothetical protein [Acinetobacter baumannii]HBM1135812.1 hypothetical protein [Acinetobacter baumannii]